MTELTTLTVAALQGEAVPGDIAGNARAAARLVGQAADRGAALAVLPELFLPAYHFPVTAWIDPADPRLDPLREAARDGAVVVVVGAAVRHADGRQTCSAVLVDATGETVAGYDKQHLCGPDEKAAFTPGDRGTTVTVAGWRFGLGICYDGCFPEHGRAAALDGAHGYLCPSAYPAGSQHRRDLYYPARALDNTMYVVFANLSGPGFNGGSAVYDPEGRPLARAADAGAAVVVATLDHAEIARVRAKHAMLADWRTGLGGPRRAFFTGGGLLPDKYVT